MNDELRDIEVIMDERDAWKGEVDSLWEKLQDAEQRLADRDTKLAAVEALAEWFETTPAPPNIAAGLEVAQGIRVALRTASLPVPTSPQTDEACALHGCGKSEAAHWQSTGTLHPFLATSPERVGQQQCKHGNTEPHYMRFTTGTTAHCPGPVSLEQQETQQ